MASRGNIEGHRHIDTNDDDMEFELATEESTPLSLDEDDADDGETILYFDAEDGTAVDAAGEEFTFELGSESETNEAEDEQGDGGGEEGGEGEGGGTNEPPRAATPTPRGVRTITMTPQQILQLLSQAGLRGVFQAQPSGRLTRSQARARGHGDDGDDDDEDGEDDDDYLDERYDGYGARRRRRRGYNGDRYPKIPSEEGKKLMESGTFGVNDRCDHSACGLPFSHTTIRRRRRLARRMLDRELGLTASGFSSRPTTLNALASQDLLPSTKADLIVSMNAPVYSGQFSEDGSFFFACGKDFRVRMYDTTNPYDWRYYKTVHYYGGQWTITDASLSPDNKLLAYSSIRPQVCLANTDQSDNSDPRMIDFSFLGSDSGNNNTYWRGNHAHFGIWSLRFSGDGTELVAGTSDQSVYVYDLEVGRSVLRIPGHENHVNAVCYGDKLSPHILYSGSDDTTLKVWDRRSLASMRPAGMFLGHTEGLTYIDSKGDGRYVISNGKDQTCKLWDLRKMISTDAGERIDTQEYTTNFDYRYSPYDVEDHIPHPHDCSLVTFYGHRVLKTLIRCHFSPPGSTNGRYIYSGSHDGKVHIWNLDGTTAGKIDVNAATKPRSTNGAGRDDGYHGRRLESIVRDCSWHPSAPVIVATSWSGWDYDSGTCTVHSWTDGSDIDEVSPDDASCTPSEAHSQAASLGSAPMGSRVTAQLNHDARFYAPTSTSTRTSARAAMLRNRMGLGALWADDDDEEDEDFVDQDDGEEEEEDDDDDDDDNH